MGWTQNIPAATPPKGASKTAQEEAREEVDHLLSLERLKQAQQVTKLRGKYAKKIYCLVVAWLAIVLAIFVACGFGWIALADSVLIALISGSTVQVIGLLVLVVRYLFPSTNNDQGQGT